MNASSLALAPTADGLVFAKVHWECQEFRAQPGRLTSRALRLKFESGVPKT